MPSNASGPVGFHALRGQLYRRVPGLLDGVTVTDAVVKRHAPDLAGAIREHGGIRAVVARIRADNKLGLHPDEETMMKQHSDLVSYRARRFKQAGMFVGLDVEDLEAAGREGLLNALLKFSASRDAQFTTFAEHQIDGFIRHEIRQASGIPSNVFQATPRINAAEARLSRSGRTPSVEELASAAGVDMDKVGRVLAARRFRDQVADAERLERVPSGNGFFNAADFRIDLENALKRLPKARRELMEEVARGKPIGEVAAERGVPITTLYMRLSRARKALRELLSE